MAFIAGEDIKIGACLEVGPDGRLYTARSKASDLEEELRRAHAVIFYLLQKTGSPIFVPYEFIDRATDERESSVGHLSLDYITAPGGIVLAAKPTTETPQQEH